MSSSPVDHEVFTSLFDNDLRLVKEHEFRRHLFRDGIPKEFQELSWKFLFQFYSFNSTPRERFMRNYEKYVEYFLMKRTWQNVVAKNELENANNSNDDYLKAPYVPFNIEIGMEELVDLSGSQFEYSEMLCLNTDYMKIQAILNVSRIRISLSKLNDDVKQIDKDLERTTYIIENEKQGASQENLQRTKQNLRNILITFSAFNQELENNKNEISTESSDMNLGYTQGMNELACLFLTVFKDEYIAYWCFSNFMLLDNYKNSSITLNTTTIEDNHVLKTNVAHYFSAKGIWKKLKHLNYLLEQTDHVLYNHFVKHKMDSLVHCHEWLLLSFMRCFKNRELYQRFFEILNSHYLEFHTSALKNISIEDIYSFDLFVCLSLLKQMRNDFLTKCDSDIEIMEVFKEYDKNKHFEKNFYSTITIAEEIFEKYCIITNKIKEIRASMLDETRTMTRFEKFKGLFFR